MAIPSQPDMADDYQFPLPGFRFHPTDQELVDFYLRRKVNNKPLTNIIQLIKQIDIYKYNPWDLPHASNSMDDKEWYFFCKRKRKYKKSVRPNRVSGSGFGFWKATGIDKPIYDDHHNYNHEACIIGLKKTLVYYRGTAGKATKTDWMMNEFRLPNYDLQQAEVWTLCRIFKRNITTRKTITTPNWREVPVAKNQAMEDNMNFKATTAIDIDIERYADDNQEQRSYISFSSNNSFISFDHVKEQLQNHGQIPMMHGGRFMEEFCGQTDPIPPVDSNVSPSSSSFSDFDEDATDLFGYEKWEELKSILESDFDS